MNESDQIWLGLEGNGRVAKISRLYLRGELGRINLNTALKKYESTGSLPCEMKALKELLLPKFEKLERAIKAYLKRAAKKREANKYASKEERILMESAENKPEAYADEDEKHFTGNATKDTRVDREEFSSAYLNVPPVDEDEEEEDMEKQMPPGSMQYMKNCIKAGGDWDKCVAQYWKEHGGRKD